MNIKLILPLLAVSLLTLGGSNVLAQTSPGSPEQPAAVDGTTNDDTTNDAADDAEQDSETLENTENAEDSADDDQIDDDQVDEQPDEEILEDPDFEESEAFEN